ncbi:energy-coupling factor transporter transmembrane component T family protein [Paenibacillus faecalis]|uniref:energy-coupling factor transporter transmembrane component T family protein n=1 Tax=Paenibacillus faecalis TaxID=2079532 RepID=UPI000D0FFD95|nr:energy-coupling factor transporter transmembrane component T [Paenibacillus faecalis]
MLIQYVQGNSILHRWDPLSKLAVLMCVAVVAMLWEGALLQAILLIGCVLTARWAGGISFRHLMRGVKLIAVVAIPYFILTAFTVPGEIVWFQWGPLKLTAQSVNQAGEMSLRMITLFVSSMAYIVSTDPQELVAELVRRLHIPYRFAFGISAALTFLPILEEEGTSIRAAQQVRGHRVPKGIVPKLSWWGKFVAAVLLNSLRRVQQTAGAMESKGFGAYSKRTFRKTIRIPVWGPLIAVIAALFTVWTWWSA